MTIVLDELIRSPQLPRYVEQLQSVLEREQTERQHFLEAITEDQKAEFINGEVIVHSPVKLVHNEVSGDLYMLLKAWVRRHRLGWVSHEKVMVSLTRNDYEPDVCFWRAEMAEGFTADQLRFPAPDFVAEVLSPSTKRVDRGVKFEDYAAHGVAEYWLIDPDGELVEQYGLEEGHYSLHIKAGSGEIASLAVPGFTIPIRAIFDEAAHQEALQRLIAS